MSDDLKPVLTMFAGINGAGKSTLHELQLTNYCKDDMGMGIRICPDEILVENDGNWQDFSDVWAADKMAYKKIDQCVEQRQSFNWEFTVISNYVVKIMKRAKELGFQIRLNFILVDDVNTSLQRIEHRVKNGGHGIPEDVVRARFARQLANMDRALPMVDMGVFFDNLDHMRVVGLITKEQPLEFFDKDTDITRDLLKISKDMTTTSVQ